MTNINDIVDDLLKKRPEKSYSNEDIFQMGLHTRRSVEMYIVDRFFEGKKLGEIGRQKSTVTRRTNRVWQRIKNIIVDQQIRGGKGIYRISERFGLGCLGFVYAENRESAKDLATLFFSALDPWNKPDVKFVKFGDPDNLSFYTDRYIAKWEKEIESIERNRATIIKKSKNLRDRIETSKTVRDHQMSIYEKK